MSGSASSLDVELERALEGLFRLGANRRFNQQQTLSVGAGVTRAGYAALRSLADQGPLSVRRLADACAMDAATASRQLQPLVEAGLVERRAVESDARQVELVLTPRGRAVYDRPEGPFTYGEVTIRSVDYDVAGPVPGVRSA